MAIESLKPAMSVSRISRAMDVPRSSIYYRKTGRTGKRKPRVSEIIESECNRRLNIVHFRRNKSDPDRRFNFDPFPHAEGDQDCTGWRCGE